MVNLKYFKNILKKSFFCKRVCVIGLWLFSGYLSLTSSHVNFVFKKKKKKKLVYFNTNNFEIVHVNIHPHVSAMLHF